MYFVDFFFCVGIKYRVVKVLEFGFISMRIVKYYMVFQDVVKYRILPKLNKLLSLVSGFEINIYFDIKPPNVTASYIHYDLYWRMKNVMTTVLNIFWYIYIFI